MIPLRDLALAALLIALLAACGAAPTEPAAPPLPTPDFATSTPLPLIEFEDEEPFYAPDFTLTDLSGASHTLSDYQGEWVLLNFWQTTCEPCVEEMPLFEQIANETENLRVLAVNVREPVDLIQPFVDELGLTYTILQSAGTVTVDYAVLSFPQTVIIDPSGEIVFRRFGPIELENFREELRTRMS